MMHRNVGKETVIQYNAEPNHSDEYVHAFLPNAPPYHCDIDWNPTFLFSIRTIVPRYLCNDAISICYDIASDV